ncbi:MAG: hypothetical protein KC427_05450 [Sulfurovum sp.]|uniref:hypothetical protein n=1 Tax=Sulfurovum sp. TaxID=1969726 RepID=UPI002867FC83|nr:hypothetical protein [Sulfurovum sp.]MCO4845448.1 hypothetical protein [Sulfurovum sp.]
MSKAEYVGPRVEISNHGIVYKKSKEDKYVYLMVALEILKDIDNDYEKKPFYTHTFENRSLKEEELHTILKCYENDIEESVSKECEKYKQKIKHEIEYIQNLVHLADIDKEVWIKNIELMKNYRVQRAINKMYYMHCIQNIIQVIRHKKIKEITTPFNKNFFHVLNTIKGALITGKPSLDAKVIEEYNEDDTMVLRLSIK